MSKDIKTMINKLKEILEEKKVVYNFLFVVLQGDTNIREFLPKVPARNQFPQEIISLSLMPKTQTGTDGSEE